MVNLLPQSDIQKQQRIYYARLATAGISFVAVAIAIGSVLMVPSYVVSERAAESAERYAQALDETIGLRERAGVGEEVRALNERVRILGEYQRSETTNAFFEDLLRERPSGVRVTGIAFKGTDTSLNVSLSGVASTREALLGFVNGLRAQGNFENVAIPVSQLAQDTNIEFSLSAQYLFSL